MKTNKTAYIFSLLAIVGLLLLPVDAFGGGKKDARIEFKEKIYDFGQISLKKGKVSHEFTFTNTGERNLVIDNARADCGCTRPEYSDAPVGPGKTGTLKVTFAPAAKGHFSKKVEVTTNGNPRKERVIIKGEVVE